MSSTPLYLEFVSEFIAARLGDAVHARAAWERLDSAQRQEYALGTRRLIDLVSPRLLAAGRVKCAASDSKCALAKSALSGYEMKAPPVRRKLPAKRNANVVEQRLQVNYLHPIEPVASETVSSSEDRLKIDNIERLSSWLSLRNRIPSFGAGDDTYVDKLYHAISVDKYLDVQHRLERNVYRPRYNAARAWLDNEEPTFGPRHDPIFVQRVVINEPENARVFLIGDLHSSLTSIVNILGALARANVFADNFTLKPNFYLIFLGDIVDRGPYGIELLTLLALLQLDNPKQTFVVNGNHEDCSTYFHYGLKQEVVEQFNIKADTPQSEIVGMMAFTNFLHYLPSAIFLQLGARANAAVYQLCHGALTDIPSEQQTIKRLLASKTAQMAFLRYNLDGELCGPTQSSAIDHLKWGDFDGNSDETSPSERGGSTKKFGRSVVRRYLTKLGLTAIISGHQDNSNFTILTPSRDADDSPALEEDALYPSLRRPRNYRSLGDSQVSFVPGRDFLACNTSSALMSKGNPGMLFDCYLMLTQRRRRPARRQYRNGS